jgi:hypothetical protein
VCVCVCVFVCVCVCVCVCIWCSDTDLHAGVRSGRVECCAGPRGTTRLTDSQSKVSFVSHLLLSTLSSSLPFASQNRSPKRIFCFPSSLIPSLPSTVPKTISSQHSTLSLSVLLSLSLLLSHFLYLSLFSRSLARAVSLVHLSFSLFSLSLSFISSSLSRSRSHR